MIISEDRVWAGSESSLQAAATAETGIMARLGTSATPSQEASALPRLLSIDGGLATISIKGPLVNSDSPFLEMFGMTGYPEIRDALTTAATDTSVKQILLDVDSGGGSVSGVDDTANLIRNIHANVKPVTTYTDGVMASAAYWLGSSAGEVLSGKTAMVGSIGVIATHKEYSAMYKADGIGVTVVRAGKEKALANSNEKLTEKGKAQIQQMVDASYQVFVEHVAEMRGKPYEYADKKMADGQEFIGKAAADVGLTDGVSTFDAVVSDLKQKIVASSEKLMHNRGKGGNALIGQKVASSTGEADMARKALSEQEVAAMAAGAVITATTEVDVSAADQAIAEAAAAAEVEAAAAEAAASEAAAATALEADKNSATVQLLNSQLLAKDEALLQAGIKASKMEEQLADARATHGPLLEIAVKSINNMQIALGGSAISMEGMSAVAVVAEHKKLTEQFTSKFKSGGISAVVGESAAVKQPQVDPRHTARVMGAGFNPKQGA